METDFLLKGKAAYNAGKYEMAIDCYEQAIAKGNAEAMYLAACMYQSGIGVAKDIEKSRKLFRQAADEGEDRAKNVLSLIENSPAVHRRVYITEACDLRKKGEYKEAMDEFRSMVGEYAIPDEYTAECIHRVGVMYKLGQGVIKDEKKAKEWFEKSVELGYWKAIKELKLDKIRPVFICEGNRAKATSLVYNECGFASDAVAKNFCQIARKFKSKIEMHSKGKIVDAKNIMMVMVVGGLQGNKIEICAEGEDSQQAVKSLANYLFSIRPKDYINVIFLDVDGVLNSAKDGYSIKLSTDLPLKLLKRIVKATKAKIVLSSSWRIGWTPASMNLLNRFKDFGLELMDCTPELPESCRGDEIKQWLNDSEYEIGRFVILDDESDMAEFTDTNLVQTDTKVGLQEKDAIKCIKMLKGCYSDRDKITSSLDKNPFKIGNNVSDPLFTWKFFAGKKHEL